MGPVKQVWIPREDGAGLTRIYTSNVTIDGVDFVLVKFKAGPYVAGEALKRQTLKEHEAYCMDPKTDPTIKAAVDADFG